MRHWGQLFSNGSFWQSTRESLIITDLERRKNHLHGKNIYLKLCEYTLIIINFVLSTTFFESAAKQISRNNIIII